MSLSILAQGTLARDPEARTGESGKPFALATLAVDSPAEEDGRLFVSLIAFGTTAECLLAKHKGDPLAVSGRAKLRTWTAKDGTERTGLSVTVDAVLGIEPRTRKTAAKPEPSSINAAEPTARQVMPAPTGGKFDDMADDIPF